MTKFEVNIPNYEIYGENSKNLIRNKIHIEDVALTSSQWDWSVKPHRHGRLFQFICIFGGGTTIRLDAEEYHLQGAGVVVVPVGIVHGFEFSPDTQGAVISMDLSLLQHILESAMPTIHSLVNRAVSIPFDADGEKYLKMYLDMMRAEFRDVDDCGKYALNYLFSMLLITSLRQIQKHELQAPDVSPQSRLLYKFKELLEENYTHHWSVAQYSELLGVTPSTLNRYCQKYFNLGSKRIILERLMNEAQRKLIFTQVSLEHIAYSLGFKDPAYFSRLFKSFAGVSPGEFRRRESTSDVK